ncbi:MAG: class I SAM-dependent methyltransferase [Candidatus Methanoperedens sp.]|nr:class I SAM-dependent methyltransferase [Candidatus Methanoperedens sp.]
MKELEKHEKEVYSKWDMDLRENRLVIVHKMILEEKPEKMLDIACSSGKFSSCFIKNGWKVFGIDISDNVFYAKERGLEAIKSNITEGVPFKNESFDLIFAGEIIEHIVDTDFFLSEIYRVLKKSGILIITTPNLASFENRMRLLFGIYPIWVNYSIEGTGHVRSYTPKVLKKQLNQHDFIIISHEGNFIPILPQFILNDVNFPLLSLTRNFYPNLSQCIILKAKKR